MSEMSVDLAIFIPLFSACAALVALATMLYVSARKMDAKPVRIRVRVRQVSRPFPPQTDDTFPAQTGFASRIAPRGPPVSSKPPLPDDDPARLQA
jgi:hypothetical protein